MWSLWWVWIVAGFVIGIVEVAVPGYIFLGFALGAIFTGSLIGLGFAGENLSVLIFIFALSSLAAWFAARVIFGSRGSVVKKWTTDINDN